VLVLLVVVTAAAERFELGGGTATWDSARAAGFVSYVLLWAAVFTGAGVNLRYHPGVGKQAVVFELHRMTATLALGFALVHVAGILMDDYIGFSLLDGVAPFTSAWRPLQVGLGTIAMWLLVAVMLSTWFGGYVPKAAWRRIHYVSYAALGLALVHALTSGSDTEHWPTHVLYSITGGALIAALLIRFVTPDWADEHRRRHPQA
jgi:sulfoxide reductase heme-binding subunit YedZ